MLNKEMFLDALEFALNSCNISFMSSTSNRTDLSDKTCPFLIIFIDSIPCKVLLAYLKDLKPIIGFIICLIAR